MVETYVRLLCPECNKSWTTSPRELPSPSDRFQCPDCPTTRPVPEFMRTEHDLDTLKQFR